MLEKQNDFMFFTLLNNFFLYSLFKKQHIGILVVSLLVSALVLMFA